MGTTYDALFANSGVALQTTAVIEGFPYIMTDGDPETANNAYSASSSACLSDFGNVTAVAGLSVAWDMQQSASPWKPFAEPIMVRFSVVPAGDAVDAMTDIGDVVWKRTGGTETSITATLDCNDTTITCQRTDDFPAAIGTLYAGPERILYSSKDTGADTFTVLDRGSCSVFETSGGSRFARTHRPTTANNVFSIQPRVSTEPRTWIGRWCAIWLHRKTGTTIDTPELDNSAAHLAFAGMITGVEEVDGATVFTAKDVRDKIYTSTLMRDPFRARVKEGQYLFTGHTFSITTVKEVAGVSVAATGDVLTVKASGASGSNEIDAGYYTCDQLADKLNIWLQGEKAAGRIYYNLDVIAQYQDSSGAIRCRLYYNDPTATAGLHREATIGSSALGYLIFMGWSTGEMFVQGNVQSGEALSDQPPLRVMLFGSNTGGNTLVNSRLALDSPHGTWISQKTLLPQALQDPDGFIDGILQVIGVGYLRAGHDSDTQFKYTPNGMDAFFVGNSAALAPNGGPHGTSFVVTVEDERSLDVQQVLLFHSTFKNLLLQLLFSTGTSGFNHATWDALATGSDTVACAIPYSIAGDDFVAEVGDLDSADAPFTCIVRKPTRFGDLLEADFLLRRCFFVWGQGRLRMGKWATPASNFSSFTLTETTKGVPSGTQDKDRASVMDDDGFMNLVKIKFNPDANGDLQDEVTLIDASSIRDHGERPFTINARNTFRQTGDVGTPLDELISHYASFFTYTSKPWLRVRRSIDFSRFEATIPGTLLALTDKYIRDPATGLRYSNQTSSGGLSGVPGMVVSHRFDWGGTEPGRDGGPPRVRPMGGECEIMLSPQRSIGAYVPCAQVDDTAADSGYDAGAKVLTCYAHEHTESSESADASFFAATDKVLVIEMDPDTAASAQSWSDTVASQTGNTITLTTGLAGFDTTKKYRVIYDAYSTCTSTQKAKVFQADDADGLIADSLQAYGYGYYPGSQGLSVVASTADETPSRHATNAYGDGVPFDVGYDRDATRLANNLIGYRRARQQPHLSSGTLDFGSPAGSATWCLVEYYPIFVGIGTLGTHTRKITVAPRMRSTDGSTASVRVRLCRLRPTGSSAYDVTFIDPYTSATFTSASTSFTVATAQTLQINHLKLTDALNGGWGWVIVEVSEKAEYTGMAKTVLGALDA